MLHDFPTHAVFYESFLSRLSPLQIAGLIKAFPWDSPKLSNFIELLLG
jgi:hypothetical protein